MYCVLENTIIYILIAFDDSYCLYNTVIKKIAQSFVIVMFRDF